jgi:SAM-dependent methyltransferase
MPSEAGAGPDDARRYYDDFSLAVGLRDWLVPNPRHEQLKLEIDTLLRGRRGVRLLDVGCGAGVMTAHLRRYGDVTGLDFSHATIDAARRLVPGATFHAGTLDSLPRGEVYDVITMFDVLEHIPAGDRPRFLVEIRSRLAEEGTLFASTPFPAYTRHRRAANDPTLQIVDEEVELPRVTAEAEEAGLQLMRFEAFDVFGGSPEYQVLVFTTERRPGGPPALRPRRLDRRQRIVGSRPGRSARRAVHAVRLLASGRRREARWIATGSPPHVRS